VLPFFVLGCCAAVFSAAPPPSEPRVEVPLAKSPPRIDGRLDDPCWRDAAVITNFTQVLPYEGASPSEPTEIRLLYDENNLYIAVRCRDSEPDKILAKTLQHDSFLSADDTVEFVFDTFHRKREGYFFRFNPAGARSEGLIENFDSYNPLWDAVWVVKARINSEGWAAEVRIPSKSLSFDPSSGVWGFNVERVIRRRQEVDRWTCIARAKRVSSLPDAGELVGLQKMRQGKGWEIKPSTTLTWADAEGRKGDWDFRPSLDVTYNITPSLKANATVYTDFAEAEVDDRIINLTRFPTFFPEKRDFFLQDASLFRFGGLRMFPITPYYSRRIGLDPDGEPLDILAGGRLTGRMDGTSVALLDVLQEGYAQDGPDNLFVGRVSRQVWGESDVGLLLTAGEPRGEGQAYLGGADFNYINSDLGDGRSLVGHAWTMGSYTDQVDGADAAFGADVDYPNEPLDVHLTARQAGEDFDPALGFVRRTGVREYIASAHYVWRLNKKWLRSVSLGVRPIWTTDLDNRLVAEGHDLPYLYATTPQLDRVFIAYNYDRDVVDEAFDMCDAATIPRGDYMNDQIGVKFNSSDARPIAVNLEVRTGNYYDGTIWRYEGSLDLRPGRALTLRPGYELREIDMPYGKFAVRVATLRFTLAASPDLSLSTLAQYDNLSDDLGISSRFRWTFKPGSDLFFVINQGFLFDDWRFHSQSTQLSAKLALRIRF